MDDNNQFIYAGLNDSSRRHRRSHGHRHEFDSAVDLYDATANTAKDDDAGTQFSASDVVAISVALCLDYNPSTSSGPAACNNQATLAIAGTNDTATRDLDGNFRSIFALHLASVAGTSLYKSRRYYSGSAPESHVSYQIIFRYFHCRTRAKSIIYGRPERNLSVNSFSLDASGGLSTLGK